MNAITRDILRTLSITVNYRGYRYILIACELIYDDETKLYNVTKDIYCEIAKICNCKVHSVERNIRTVIFQAWARSRERFKEIAGYPLLTPPTVSEFLSMVTSYAKATAGKAELR